MFVVVATVVVATVVLAVVVAVFIVAVVVALVIVALFVVIVIVIFGHFCSREPMHYTTKGPPSCVVKHPGSKPWYGAPRAQKHRVLRDKGCLEDLVVV